VDVAVPVLGGQALRVLPGVVEVAPDVDDLGVERPHRLDLHRIRSLRDAHDGPHAEEPSGVGHGLAVIAGGRRDDAAGAFAVTELRDQVDPATDLEGPDRLVVFVLDPSLRTNQLAQRWIWVKRGGPKVEADACSCGQHVDHRGNALIGFLGHRLMILFARSWDEMPAARGA